MYGTGYSFLEKKAVLPHATEALGRRGGELLLILDLGTRRE
jgi:hypothetical protein